MLWAFIAAASRCNWCQWDGFAVLRVGGVRTLRGPAPDTVGTCRYTMVFYCTLDTPSLSKTDDRQARVKFVDSGQLGFGSGVVRLVADQTGQPVATCGSNPVLSHRGFLYYLRASVRHTEAEVQLMVPADQILDDALRLRWSHAGLPIPNEGVPISKGWRLGERRGVSIVANGKSRERATILRLRSRHCSKSIWQRARRFRPVAAHRALHQRPEFAGFPGGK